ncbi:MAG TPA: Nif3-like dinuclear metal center hexameric protein [Selenomonadales bacterium]|nr:Nif3-like dinuclear metal center hexameric protein [Selenomonadales bacterium]
MSVTCREIMNAMEQLAPGRLAAAWDNVGLLVGNPSQPVTHLLVALDAAPELVEYAADSGVDLIITHHPLIFQAMNSIRTDSPVGAMAARLLKADIALYAAHTNLDAAAGGVNDALAGALGLGNLRPLRLEGADPLLKLAVFVPVEAAERVREAIGQAGAGHIGNYSQCAFLAEGTGTFLPLGGANPYVGEQGKLARVPEVRLETILPESISDRIVKAMLEAHPYEEVAYDLYSLKNPGIAYGLGRVGELPGGVALRDFAAQIKTALEVPFVRLTGPENRTVKKVAVCGGSGAGLIGDAARSGADVLVTGDVKYHDAQQAQRLGLTVIDAGHFGTERPVVAAVAAYLRRLGAQNNWNVKIETDQLARDVFRVV